MQSPEVGPEFQAEPFEICELLPHGEGFGVLLLCMDGRVPQEEAEGRLVGGVRILCG